MDFQLLSQQLANGELPPAEICARYVLLHLVRRHGSQWLSGPRLARRKTSGDGLLQMLEEWGIALTQKTRARLEGLNSVHELFSHYFFRGVVLDAHEGILGWLEHRYPLQLRTDIPQPEEMLTAQSLGLRYVTLMLAPEQLFVRYGRHTDACDFLLHDFEHAQKFYGDANSHRGQVRFFRALRANHDDFACWTHDISFVAELDYLKSDMNSHPVHLVKYLKAIVLNAEIRRTQNRHPELDWFWSELFSRWQMPPLTVAAALRLNQPEAETEDDKLVVCEFFMEDLRARKNRNAFSDLFVPSAEVERARLES